MAKLSLWLVSMDPERPFTFLDDRLAAGDSLLGITALEQLEYMHLDPKKGREIHERGLVDFTAGVRDLVAEVAAARRNLADLDGSTIDGLVRKRSVLADVELKTSRARLFADLAVGAALAHAGRGDRGLRDGSRVAADYARRIDTAEPDARQQARQWLDTNLPDGAFRREPVHWPLMFPEVFENGGFGAVIGNPPFLGGSKISLSTGSNYRGYLAESAAGGKKGNSDLVGYFTLRAHALINRYGQAGLIATNTLAQGDTREVSLDQLVASGVSIRRSIKSRPWPSRSVALEFCAIWTSRARLSNGAQRIADDQVVANISPSLEPASRRAGNPYRLHRNTNISFKGSFVLGTGFTVEPNRARALIEMDRRYADVLFPYPNGKDLNTRSDCSASRWVINFRDWPESRAKEYSACYDQVLREVKPERDKNNRKARRERWWQYGDYAKGLESRVSRLKRVIVLAQTSSTVMPAMVKTGQVFDQKLVIFTTDDTAMLVLLSSSPHYWWTIRRSSTMKTDISYSPTDVLQTFPLPELTEEMRELGDRLDAFRLDVMLSRDSGLRPPELGRRSQLRSVKRF